jgi:hypothetical protein
MLPPIELSCARSGKKCESLLPGGVPPTAGVLFGEMRKLTSGRLLWSPVELDDLPPLPLGNPFHALRELSRHVKRNYFCHGSIPTGILFFCRTALPPHPVRHHNFASTTMVPIGAKSFHPRFIKPLSSVSDAIGEWPTQACFWFEWGYSHVTDMVRKRTYVVLMRRGVRRFQQSRESHFISICCYHRRRLLSSNESQRISEPAWERVWRSYGLQVCESVVALSERRRGGSVIEITHSSQRAA